MSGEVRKAVEKGNLEFAESVRRGDAAGVAALYTEDAVLLPPNSDMVRGRQGIKGFWGAAMRMGVKDGVLTTVEISGSGDMICEMGKYTMKIQPQGQQSVEDKGKYIVVWKRVVDGWKMHRDIWNSSMPPPK